jgi:hypothetical protein
MSSALSEDIRRRVDALSEQVKGGAVTVPTTWTGPEFPNPV